MMSPLPQTAKLCAPLTVGMFAMSVIIAMRPQVQDLVISVFGLAGLSPTLVSVGVAAFLGSVSNAVLISVMFMSKTYLNPVNDGTTAFIVCPTTRACMF